jgi:2-methylcitrate dehydratase
VQYIVATGLLKGRIAAEDYEDAAAADPRIDWLRARTQVREHRAYSADYRDPAQRASANAVQVFFADGSASPRVEVRYPLGHARRRRQALPLLRRKFTDHLALAFAPKQRARIAAASLERQRLQALAVDDWMGLLAI